MSRLATSLSGPNNAPTFRLVGFDGAIYFDIPFEGPVGGIVGRVDGEFIINPTYEQQLASDLHLVAGTKQG